MSRCNEHLLLETVDVNRAKVGEVLVMRVGATTEEGANAGNCKVNQLVAVEAESVVGATGVVAAVEYKAEEKMEEEATEVVATEAV